MDNTNDERPVLLFPYLKVLLDHIRTCCVMAAIFTSIIISLPSAGQRSADMFPKPKPAASRI